MNADYPPILIASLETSDQRADPAHAMSRSIATEDERRVLSIGEANDYWLRKTVDFIRDEPLRFGLTLWQKFVHSMGAYRWNDVPAARDHEVDQAPMGVLFSLIASLGLLGFLVELKNWKGALLFYVFAAAQLGVMILFYVSARHQTVLIPSLIYFSLATCERMARRDALSGLLLVTWLPLWGYLSVPDDLDSDGRHRQMGEVSLAAKVQQTRGLLGKLTLARRHEIAAETLATAPWLNERVYPIYYDLDGQSIEQAAAGILSANESRSPSAEFDLAFLEYLAGDWDSADDRFQRLSEAGRRFYRSYFQSSEPLYYRGRISVARGDVAGGIKLLEAALESSPGDPWTLAELFVATGDVQYHERIERYFSGLDASWMIGRAQLYHGEYEAAERSFARLLPQVPNFRNGMLHHAVALGRSGQLDRGAGTLIDARGISEFPLYLPGEVVELAERWAAAYPGDVEVGIAAAGILVSHGHYDSALRTLEGLEDDRFGRVEGVRAGIRSRRGPGASTSGH